MEFLWHVLERTEEYRSLRRSVKAGRTPVMAVGLSAVHKAHLVCTLCKDLQKRALLLASDESEGARMVSDLTAMGLRARFYPSRDFNFRDKTSVSSEYVHQRIGALFAFLQGECDVIVACADGALQYTIPPDVLRQHTAVLREGDEFPLQKLLSLLLSCGYVRSEQVEGSGQFSVRGGIVDVFMPSASKPVRLEYWGDEIDSLSDFDPETQRRLERREKVVITPSVELLIENPEELSERIRTKAASLRDKNAPKAKAIMQEEADLLLSSGRLSSADKYYSLIYPAPATLYDYFEGNELVFVSEQPNQREKVRAAMLRFTEELQDLLKEGVLCRGLDRFSGEWEDHLSALAARDTVFMDNFTRGTCELPLRELVSFTAKQLSLWSGSVSVLCEDLETLLTPGHTVIVLAGTEKNTENLLTEMALMDKSAQRLQSTDPLPGEGLYIAEGTLSAGMEYPSAGFCLIAHSHTSSSSGARKKNSRKKPGALFSLSELQKGDYVVHSTYGIGQFLCVEKVTAHGVTKDYISIRYARDDILHVPVTQLDMVAKYIGPKDETVVRLSRLGSGEWQRSKARVRSAVKDIADKMIRMYAQRMQSKGFAFSGDTEWQRDFEHKFEYEETEDQKRCIEEIKADMERAVPMDRLLCGDVGFGKTEVALRAAFKCVTDGKQCALLVPTTILAWQHYQTVLRRFEGYPIKVELLSRFRTPQQQAQIIEDLKKGNIDMVIGTHRLIQKDIQFRDIGLFIVDEEQRFGVEQKEDFKQTYRQVDILTLSATPIPRTLNMAMSGIRDMSTIEEAPQDRRPVQSYVLEYDAAVIGEAIRRELRRGGQVFYLYNRVDGIEAKAAEIEEAVPEAKVGIGHGQMSEGELSEVWRQMLEQEINVLVCTTIIETGVDIPNANTLIIEHADRMGLSQLHQLRGRVGRSSRRAYAYFTFEANKALSEISQKRLSAIREFTEFGSGFKIAMRDLELRGAGDMFGAMQHGNMTDVGYDMYMKLLNQAVSEAKGEQPRPEDKDCLIDINTDAHIPEWYIESLTQRLEIYRRIADIRTEEDAQDVLDELIDRFGDPPKVVLGLLRISLIRSTAQRMGVTVVRQTETGIQLFFEQIRCEGAAQVMERMGTRALVNTVGNPFISIRFQPKETNLSLLEKVFLGK